MGWNIEIATIRVPQTTALHELVPDVFEPTDDRVSWEDATSALRDTDLCAGWIAGWGIVIDVMCRLSSKEPYLEEVASNTDAFVFRVANQPIEAHYRLGKKAWKHNSLEAVVGALGIALPPDDYVDGETIARDWIQQRTGLDFTDDFWRVKYQVFKLP